MPSFATARSRLSSATSTDERASTEYHGNLLTSRRKLVPKSKKYKNKFKKKKFSPRNKIYVLACAMNSFIIGLFCLNLALFWKQLHQDALHRVEQELRLMDWTYSVKIDQMGLGFGSKANNSLALFRYLQDKSPTDYLSVKADLVSETTRRQIEYATLLDSSGRILISANNNRTGEMWDPAQLVSYLRSMPRPTQIKFTALASYNEIIKEKIPLWRERMSQDQPVPLLHPYDVKGPSLVRYVATPVVFQGLLIGVLIAGDIVNGKTPIAYRTVNSFGDGMAAVFSASNAAANITTVLNLLDTYCSTGHVLSATVGLTPPSLLQQASALTTKTISTYNNGWYFAAKRVLNTQPHADGSLQISNSPALLVRGMTQKDNNIFSEIKNKNIILFCCVLLVDVLLLIFSLALFILPLEKLALMLKHKSALSETNEKLNTTYQNLLHRKKMIYFVIVPVQLIKSIIISIFIVNTLKSGLKSSQSQWVSASKGVKQIMYRLKMDQMSFGFAGDALNTAIQGLLENPSNPSFLSSSKATLAHELTTRKIEIAVLVDANKNIVQDPNMQVNSSIKTQAFDPNGLVSLTLKTALRYKTSAILSYAELLERNIAIKTEQLNPSLPKSALSPLLTHSPGVVRLTSSPVYIASNTNLAKPDGVLISGDVLNGKTIMCERVLQVMITGYCGVFIYDESKKNFLLASSMLVNTKGMFVDMSISDFSCLFQAVSSPGQQICYQKLFGTQHIVAVDPLPKDTYISVSGELETHREVEVAFVVYAMPLQAESSSSLWIGTSFLVITIFISGIFSSVLTFLAFKPVQSFLSRMRKGCSQSKNASNKSTRDQETKAECVSSLTKPHIITQLISVRPKEEQ